MIPAGFVQDPKSGLPAAELAAAAGKPSTNEPKGPVLKEAQPATVGPNGQTGVANTEAQLASRQKDGVGAQVWLAVDSSSNDSSRP